MFIIQPRPQGFSLKKPWGRGWFIILLRSWIIPFKLSICTPCCMLLRVVGSCCIRLHTTAKSDAATMSRNLARQISRDLHSDCFAMVLTAGFYCDSRAHNVRKVRVVKYIVVYGQIKAADQKYCHNQKWRRKLKENSN